MIKRALVILCCIAGAAFAQPMAGMQAAMKGTPLPAHDLPAGTISVRVVAGTPTAPVPDVTVSLTVNGTAREARSDDEGRAFFKDLPVGAKVQAKIQGEDGKDVVSDDFDVPGDSGVKLMLSTRPPTGGAPFAGGGAMPEPRKLSGTPRPEQNDPGGTFTVRLTYDDLKEKAPPAGVNVALVGYAADDSVGVQVVPTDQTGHARFTNLDRTGETAYYALAELPRGSGVDRLWGQPVVMVPQEGAVMALSSEKRDSTAPVIDDVGDDGAAAGKVRVTLEGAGDLTTRVTIFDAATHAPIAAVQAQPGGPDPTQIQGSAPFEARTDLAAGALDVEVTGGPGTEAKPLAHVGVTLVPADAQQAPPDAPHGETGADGKTHVTAAKPGQVRAVVSLNGRDVPTDVFDLGKTGGVLRVEAHWPEHGRPEAMLDVAGKAGQVVYAEAAWRGNQYRSRPFQLVDGRGAHVNISIFPRVMFSFSWTSHIQDEFLQVQGRFEVYNTTWIPIVGEGDGLLIPLPKGFKGAALAEQDQADVAVAQGEGFRIVRPLAPGGRRFLGGFNVPVDGGKIDWALDLPFGAVQSGIEITQIPGMSVQTPSGVTGRVENDSRGQWYVLAPISILPKQSMQMTITGMPSPPGWTKWVPRVLGLLVVGGLVAGLALALALKRAPAKTGKGGRRQKLLDELVELERRHGSEADPERREKLLAELERLWEQE
ncbi:MAG TPA: carboxypeptidase-like regulatory domain-containing protein [Kofleriaceae bacterium]|nr:carboxypeptidase-like regulatory domain-containing protein [Kofleriaceae bacterium]